MTASRRVPLALLLLVLAACHRDDTSRCARCGMVIAPKSTWETDLAIPEGSTTRYDTPRCGIRALREASVAHPGATLRVHEFYDGTVRDAKDVLFVSGSDVVGPMGPDLVPVDRARAAKFSADHAGKRTLPLDAVTDDVLREEP